MRAHVACVILGAGAGTRFGEPKAGALLPGGERFIDAIVRSAQDGGVAEVVAVLPSGVVPPNGIRCIVNHNPGGEQIESLRMGLAQLANTPAVGTLVWPVDHPFVRASTVGVLLSAVEVQRPVLALPAFRGKHGHPVYFSRDVWRELVTVREGGARTVTHALAHEALEVPIDDEGVVRNIDTRLDLMRSRRLRGSR